MLPLLVKENGLELTFSKAIEQSERAVLTPPNAEATRVSETLAASLLGRKDSLNLRTRSVRLEFPFGKLGNSNRRAKSKSRTKTVLLSLLGLEDYFRTPLDGYRSDDVHCPPDI